MIEVNVNGIPVNFNVDSGFSSEVKIHTLLREGDECEVDDDGIIRKGVVKNIVRLSNGKMLFSVDLLNSPIKDWGMFEGERVAPSDPVQCQLRLTAVDMIIRKYEPKGQSTNVSLWGTER